MYEAVWGVGSVPSVRLDFVDVSCTNPPRVIYLRLYGVCLRHTGESPRFPPHYGVHSRSGRLKAPPTTPCNRGKEHQPTETNDVSGERKGESTREKKDVHNTFLARQNQPNRIKIHFPDTGGAVPFKSPPNPPPSTNPLRCETPSFDDRGAPLPTSEGVPSSDNCTDNSELSTQGTQKIRVERISA